jgi:hypothetical protein
VYRAAREATSCASTSPELPQFQKTSIRIVSEVLLGQQAEPQSELLVVPLPPTIMKKLSEHPRRFAGHDQHTAGPRRGDGSPNVRPRGPATEDAADIRKARDRSLVFVSSEGHAMNASNSIGASGSHR